MLFRRLVESSGQLVPGSRVQTVTLLHSSGCNRLLPMWVIDHLRPHTDNVTEHHAHCNQLLQPAHLALQFIISASQRLPSTQQCCKCCRQGNTSPVPLQRKRIPHKSNCYAEQALLGSEVKPNHPPGLAVATESAVENRLGHAAPLAPCQGALSPTLDVFNCTTHTNNTASVGLHHDRWNGSVTSAQVSALLP